MAGFIYPKTYGDSYRVFSNNHVLAAGGHRGDRIYSMEDGRREIGALENSLAIYSDAANYLDLAVAKLQGYGPCSTPSTVRYRLPNKFEVVTKTGATTGYTKGQVISTNYNVSIDYDGVSAYFKDQIMIARVNKDQIFSDRGDSGSMIRTLDGQFAGLLFAGNGQQTFANKSAQVINQLTYWGYL
jgi:hypothetical protein